MSSSERNRRYEEEKRKTLGDEEYKRLQHEAYERRKDRLKISRELKKKQERGSESRIYLFYQGVKLGLTLAMSHNKRQQLDEETQDQIDLWAIDATQRMSEENMDIERVNARWVRAINVAPPVGTWFFNTVSKWLDDEEKDVWEFVYLLLMDSDPEQEKHVTCYIVEVETGVPSRKAHKALKHLAKLEVIDYRESDNKEYIKVLEGQVKHGSLSTIYEALPIYIRRGSKWAEEE